MEEGVSSWGYSPSEGPEVYRGKLFRVAYPHLPNAICVNSINARTFSANLW